MNSRWAARTYILWAIVRRTLGSSRVRVMVQTGRQAVLETEAEACGILRADAFVVRRQKNTAVFHQRDRYAAPPDRPTLL